MRKSRKLRAQHTLTSCSARKTHFDRATGEEGENCVRCVVHLRWYVCVFGYSNWGRSYFVRLIYFSIESILILPCRTGMGLLSSAFVFVRSFPLAVNRWSRLIDDWHSVQLSSIVRTSLSRTQQIISNAEWHNFYCAQHKILSNIRIRCRVFLSVSNVIRQK